MTKTIYKAVAINESKNLSTAIKAYNKAKAKMLIVNLD